LDGPQRLFDQSTEERYFLPISAKEEKLLSCPVLTDLVTAADNWGVNMPNFMIQHT
jgi:hypothetical protein